MTHKSMLLEGEEKEPPSSFTFSEDVISRLQTKDLLDYWASHDFQASHDVLIFTRLANGSHEIIADGPYHGGWSDLARLTARVRGGGSFNVKRHWKGRFFVGNCVLGCAACLRRTCSRFGTTKPC